ncbi:MAG TPA: FHA domain-containing protein [Gemmatimonadales bacterium]|jgi:pSer/pThr/pTyr-binding forkhead associated (FHA) protein
MSFLEVGGQRVTIPPGESVVGSDRGAAVMLADAGVLPRHAVLQAAPDGQVVIRRADDGAEILINGVRLGAQPTPLLHGDKVEVAGHELLFVDERRSGSTQYIQAVNPAAMAAAAGRPGAGRTPTAGTGGRIVSLTDGREYAVEQSLVFGREASCEVVITSKDVSRRHAEIVPTPQGYLVVDSSTNGTFVNGQRVPGQLLLARADVIRIGDNDFRFYADSAAPPPPPAPPPAADRRLANTLFGVKVPGAGAAASPPGRATPPAATPPPAAPRVSAPAARAGARGELAHLVIRSGVLKGQRLAVRTTLANIGRADYNDLVLPDDSVSTVHAKLQRREGIWVIVDVGSTNGTFADGERVTDEAPLSPGALLRFGEVRAFFEPIDLDEPVQGGSTKVLQAIRLPPEPK